MNAGEDPRWHAVLDAMRQASKTRPDDPNIVTEAMHALADMIVAGGDLLSDEHIGILVAVGGILWAEGMREASAQIQTMVALGRISPISRGRAA